MFQNFYKKLPNYLEIYIEIYVNFLIMITFTYTKLQLISKYISSIFKLLIINNYTCTKITTNYKIKKDKRMCRNKIYNFIKLIKYSQNSNFEALFPIILCNR